MQRSRLFLDDSNMPMSPPHASIQSYNLFGEVADLPDVVHCETIAARSKFHDWEFAPHRHSRLHQVLLVESGGGEARLEDGAHALKPIRVVNVPRDHIHGFSFTPGTRGWVVTAAMETIEQLLASSDGVRQVLSQARVVRGTKRISTAIEQIFAEFAGRRFARAQILRSLLGALIGLVAREMVEAGMASGATSGAGLFQRFETLLDKHFLEHWTVANYADALCVTPTHLSRIARAANGRAASQLILERLIREARRNLVYTNLPISTIAYSLGFSEPAYFSRVFSAASGCSPRDFRLRVLTQSETRELRAGK